MGEQLVLAGVAALDAAIALWGGLVAFSLGAGALHARLPLADAPADGWRVCGFHVRICGGLRVLGDARCERNELSDRESGLRPRAGVVGLRVACLSA